MDWMHLYKHHVHEGLVSGVIIAVIHSMASRRGTLSRDFWQCCTVQGGYEWNVMVPARDARHRSCLESETP